MLKAISVIMAATILCTMTIQYYEVILNKATPSLPSHTGKQIVDNASIDGKLNNLKILANVIYPELEKHKESLENTISQLKSELSDKEEELVSLDEELSELELRYNRLVKENMKITEQINSLTQAAQK